MLHCLAERFWSHMGALVVCVMLTEAKIVLFWAKPQSSNLLVVFVYSMYLNMPEIWSESPRVWATPSQHLAGSFNVKFQVTFHEVKVNKNWKEVCFFFLSAHHALNNLNRIDSAPTECLYKQPNNTSVKAPHDYYWNLFQFMNSVSQIKRLVYRKLSLLSYLTPISVPVCTVVE